VSDLNEKNYFWRVNVLRTLDVWHGSLSSEPAASRSVFRAGYEADGAKLKKQIDGFFTSKRRAGFKPSEHAGKKIKGLVAPTYDLKQAGPIYAWAYKELQDAEQPDLFVIIARLQPVWTMYLP